MHTDFGPLTRGKVGYVAHRAVELHTDVDLLVVIRDLDDVDQAAGHSSDPYLPVARLVVTTASEAATSRRISRLMLESCIGYTVIGTGQALCDGFAVGVVVDVARAAAVAELSNAVKGTFRGLRMSGRLEVLRVAAAAAAGAGGVGVRHLVRVGRMTGDAVQRR